eukprot:tig00021522_g22103.t1
MIKSEGSSSRLPALIFIEGEVFAVDKVLPNEAAAAANDTCNFVARGSQPASAAVLIAPDRRDLGSSKAFVLSVCKTFLISNSRQLGVALEIQANAFQVGRSEPCLHYEDRKEYGSGSGQRATDQQGTTARDQFLANLDGFWADCKGGAELVIERKALCVPQSLRDGEGRSGTCHFLLYVVPARRARALLGKLRSGEPQPGSGPVRVEFCAFLRKHWAQLDLRIVLPLGSEPELDRELLRACTELGPPSLPEPEPEPEPAPEAAEPEEGGGPPARLSAIPEEACICAPPPPPAPRPSRRGGSFAADASPPPMFGPDADASAAALGSPAAAPGESGARPTPGRSGRRRSRRVSSAAPRSRASEAEAVSPAAGSPGPSARLSAAPGPGPEAREPSSPRISRAEAKDLAAIPRTRSAFLPADPGAGVASKEASPAREAAAPINRQLGSPDPAPQEARAPSSAPKPAATPPGLGRSAPPTPPAALSSVSEPETEPEPDTETESEEDLAPRPRAGGASPAPSRRLEEELESAAGPAAAGPPAPLGRRRPRGPHRPRPSPCRPGPRWADGGDCEAVAEWIDEEGGAPRPGPSQAPAEPRAPRRSTRASSSSSFRTRIEAAGTQDEDTGADAATAEPAAGAPRAPAGAINNEGPAEAAAAAAAEEEEEEPSKAGARGNASSKRRPAAQGKRKQYEHASPEELSANLREWLDCLKEEARGAAWPPGTASWQQRAAAITGRKGQSRLLELLAEAATYLDGRLQLSEALASKRGDATALKNLKKVTSMTAETAGKARHALDGLLPQRCGWLHDAVRAARPELVDEERAAAAQAKARAAEKARAEEKAKAKAEAGEGAGAASEAEEERSKPRSKPRRQPRPKPQPRPSGAGGNNRPAGDSQREEQPQTEEGGSQSQPSKRARIAPSRYAPPTPETAKYKLGYKRKADPDAGRKSERPEKKPGAGAGAPSEPRKTPRKTQPQTARLEEAEWLLMTENNIPHTWVTKKFELGLPEWRERAKAAEDVDELWPLLESLAADFQYQRQLTVDIVKKVAKHKINGAESERPFFDACIAVFDVADEILDQEDPTRKRAARPRSPPARAGARARRWGRGAGARASSKSAPRAKARKSAAPAPVPAPAAASGGRPSEAGVRFAEGPPPRAGPSGSSSSSRPAEQPPRAGPSGHGSSTAASSHPTAVAAAPPRAAAEPECDLRERIRRSKKHRPSWAEGVRSYVTRMLEARGFPGRSASADDFAEKVPTLLGLQTLVEDAVETAEQQPPGARLERFKRLLADALLMNGMENTEAVAIAFDVVGLLELRARWAAPN